VNFSPYSLTMLDAGPALQQGLAAIASGQTSIDLGGLNNLDSAAVATLVAWQRAAQAKGVQLQFTQVPPSLKSLAQLYGVDLLLSE
jgi:phospholipid transport system transporter-binding protein